jgi:uncharacterized protein YecE (DUF72 family)
VARLRQLFLGTSGWQYGDWKGLFYPSELPSQERFNYYQQRFNTVEINSSFYHFPRQSTIENWYQVARKGFIYCIKVWRMVTHLKKLKAVERELTEFFQRVSYLKEKLGVYLYQLPPSLHIDLDLLRLFLKLLPPHLRHTIEFRHNSWFDTKVFKLLERRGVAYCIADAPRIKTSFDIVTSDFAYIRFHGHHQWYADNYTTQELKDYATQIKKNILGKGHEVYIYFNNTYNAYAVENALYLRELLER